jgi:hypothetical protein
MTRNLKKLGVFFTAALLVFVTLSPAQRTRPQLTEEEQLLQVMHSINSQTLFDYVKEMASDKYSGRLTGTEGYNLSAEWLVSHFKKWGIKPAGDNGTFLQAFPNPYTLIYPDCEVALHMPVKDSVIKKYYKYEQEFVPGATSASGEVTAEVIYVGYGITAPELGFDEYAGFDVKDKIVMMEREAPVSSRDAEVFKKWRPYSFHQYKLENAVAHGAKGMLYNYGPISNPNNSYREGFIYSHIGTAASEDVFAGTGKTHRETVKAIQDALKPQSFASGKVFTIKNTTKHVPDGIGTNVIGLMEGSDPVLKDEVIIIGGHLDHLGRCYEIMPGANDNASAVAVMMGVAEGLYRSPVKPKRSIMFLAFGAEEQAVAGSEFYVNNPVVPLEKTVGLLNMDGVGSGHSLSAGAAENFPAFWAFVKKANDKYVHRIFRGSYFANNARPRLDAARFMWKDVPTLTFGAYPSSATYHLPGDSIDKITPEIMEDLTQILFMAVIEMANAETLNFRN